jgi:hypothetical protein
MGAPRIGDNFQSGMAAKRPAVAKAMAGKLQIYADRIETFGVSIT